MKQDLFKIIKLYSLYLDVCECDHWPTIHNFCLGPLLKERKKEAQRYYGSVYKKR
jgi:hypothetical protein